MSLSNNFDFAPIEIGTVTKHCIPNDNWLYCDGKSFSQEDYPELYDKLSILEEGSLYNFDENCNLYDGGAIEILLNNKKVRVSYTQGNTTYKNVKFKIHEYNESLKKWEQKCDIALNSNTSASTGENYTNSIQSCRLFYVNNYYVLLLRTQAYYNSNIMYKSNIYVGTSLSNLTSKGYFDMDQSGEWLSVQYHNGTYYFPKMYFSDNDTLNIYTTTNITASYSNSQPTGTVIGYNYLSAQYPMRSGFFNNLPVFFNSQVSSNTNGYTPSLVYYNKQYKDSNGNVQRQSGTITENDTTTSPTTQKYISYGSVYSWLDGGDMYVISCGGNSPKWTQQANQGNQWTTYAPYIFAKAHYYTSGNAQDVKWDMYNISNIVRDDQVIWGVSVNGKNITLAIGSPILKMFDTQQNNAEIKIIRLPIEDLKNNNASRVRVLKDFGYTVFGSSKKTVSANSNGVYTGYDANYGGGYTITDDLSLIRDQTYIHASNNGYNYCVRERKGVLPKIEGYYIKAK